MDKRAVILDSGIIIAAYNPEDTHHIVARELLPLLLKDFRLVVTEAIWGEVLTFLRRRGGIHRAIQAAEALLISPRIRLVHSNRRLSNSAYSLFKQYNGKHPGFSYTDALSVAVMEQEKIKVIASLDSDFDGIRGIQRIASLRDLHRKKS